jgi:hypothetical protein
VQYLTERTEMQVVGGVLSPAHDSYVRNQCRRFPAHAIPVKHRMAMTELAVDGSSWLSVRRWEATRRLVMDYRSVLKNVQQVRAALIVFAAHRGRSFRVVYPVRSWHCDAMIPCCWVSV